MKNIHLLLPIIILFCCSNVSEDHEDQSCEWCGATEAPQNVSPTTVIAGINETGDRIKINGTVYQADSKTPAEGIILYLYHTNAKGIYPKRGDETGNGKRHGYLRGWIKTGTDGKYSFETIKPEPYPGRTAPAHIHITVKEPGKKEYWLKDYFFKGDQLLTPGNLENETNQEQFNHVISLSRQGELLVGKRDIILKN